MKKNTKLTTEFRTEGSYVKSDRQSSYPVCLNVNGKEMWYKKEEITTVVLDGLKMDVNRFFNLLHI